MGTTFAMREFDINTGLATPGYLIAMGSRELSFAQETGYPLSVLTVSFNAESRHRGFDEKSSPGLVKTIGEKIAKLTGDGSMVSHIGNGEFTVLLPGTPASKAEEIGRIVTKELNGSGNIIGSLHLNAYYGIASSDNPVSGFSDLISRSIRSIVQSR
jgi:GGDEF domain-containing protein